MAQSAPARTKINTKSNTTGPRAAAQRPQAGRPGRPAARAARRVSGEARESVRESARPVVEVEFGITGVPAGGGGGAVAGGVHRERAAAVPAGRRPRRSWPPSWRRSPNGCRPTRPDMERPGADLIAHYLDPDRLPGRRAVVPQARRTPSGGCASGSPPRSSARSPARTSRPAHMQQIVNAAPTAGEGDRVHGMLSALVAAGIEGGYLANPRLAMVHWQAGGPPAARPAGDRPGSRRCGSIPPRSRPTATSASSARRWPRAGTGSGMS